MILSVLNINFLWILLITAVLGLILIPRDIGKGERPTIITQTKINWRDISIVLAVMVSLFLLAFFNVKLVNIAEVFLKIGALVFGNGFTMLPLIQQEVVNIHHWLNLNQFMIGVALGQITPGPIVITATFVGYKVMGFMGAVAATLSIFMPSFLLVILTFGMYAKIKSYAWVNSAIKGVLAAFVGLMTYMVINTGRHALNDVLTITLFVLSFVMLQFKKWDTKWVILSGTGLYLIVYDFLTLIK